MDSPNLPRGAADRGDRPTGLMCDDATAYGRAAGSRCPNTARFTYRPAGSQPAYALCPVHARRFAGKPGLAPIRELLAVTEREQAALRLFAAEGDNVILEGWLDNLWPLIRRPRTIVDSLLAKGLVTLGAWHDDERRYELHLTDTGADLLPCAFSDDERDHQPGPHARCCVCAKATCDACGDYHDDPDDGEDWYCPDHHPAARTEPEEVTASGLRV